MGWQPYVVYVEKTSSPDWTTMAISLGSLFVAAIAVILTYKARTTPLQQALHARQVEASLDTMGKVGTFQNRFLGAVKLLSVDAQPQRVRQVLGDLITGLLYDIECLSVVLPERLMESLVAYATVVIDLHSPEQGFAERLAAFRAPDDASLVSAYRNVARTARRELGIKPLGEKTAKQIGVRPAQ